MPVPPYQEFMLPVLKLLSDGKERTMRDAKPIVAAAMRLTPEQMAVRQADGAASWAKNCEWAFSYLKNAVALEKPSRGVYRITDRGRQILHANPQGVSNAVLMQYAEFREFLRRAREGAAAARTGEEGTVSVDGLSPDGRLELAYKELHAALASDLLDRVQSSDPSDFEKIVIDLLVAMGYGGSREDAAQVQGGPGDGGIDGTIKQDRLGLDTVYVQAKRWKDPVGFETLTAFAGALGGHHASKGIFVTTSRFTKDAVEYVRRADRKIVLIDGPKLADLMIEYGVGVSPDRRIVINKIDSDYFDE